MNRINKYVQKVNRLMKTDPRARYTKSVIEEAFLSIVHEKPLSKVTVSEICARAEINRGTFYRYYLDVYDLADKMADEGLERVRKAISGESGKDFKKALADMLRFLKEDSRLFYLALSGIFDENRQNSFMQRVFAEFFTALGEQTPDADSDLRLRQFAYISGGSGALIEYWLRSGSKERPEEMAEMISGYADLLIHASF